MCSHEVAGFTRRRRAERPHDAGDRAGCDRSPAPARARVVEGDHQLVVERQPPSGCPPRAGAAPGPVPRMPIATCPPRARASAAPAAAVTETVQPAAGGSASDSCCQSRCSWRTPESLRARNPGVARPAGEPRGDAGVRRRRGRSPARGRGVVEPARLHLDVRAPVLREPAEGQSLEPDLAVFESPAPWRTTGHEEAQQRRWRARRVGAWWDRGLRSRRCGRAGCRRRGRDAGCGPRDRRRARRCRSTPARPDAIDRSRATRCGGCAAPGRS